MSDDRKTEPPLHLDIPFEEALRRYVQTDPNEVEPPAGKEPKVTKAARRLASVASLAPEKPRKGKGGDG
jgi:hypothetical protein